MLLLFVVDASIKIIFNVANYIEYNVVYCICVTESLVSNYQEMLVGIKFGSWVPNHHWFVMGPL